MMMMMMMARVLRTTITCLLLLPNAVSAIEGMLGSTQDPSSYANVDQFEPSHLSFELSVSFEESSTFGTVTHTLTALQDNVTTVFLDVWDGLDVLDTMFQTAMIGFEDFAQAPFEITTPNPNIGNALGVTLPVEMMTGTVFFLRLGYRTNADTTAMSWMTPSQTAGKELPFMYSLCQMNFCRDLAPMMDTPSQKITYDATVVAPSELVVAMSANETASMALNETHTVSSFECSIKIPSYLIAIVVGDLATSSLSSRVSVMSEPSLLESAAAEFVELPDVLDYVEDVSYLFLKIEFFTAACFITHPIFLLFYFPRLAVSLALYLG
jgi:leukotriene-A4 hydrolase